tara:strand:- start:40 stop:2022 length:1983 start_codon:yes stop_codon:yes gene_type:complete
MEITNLAKNFKSFKIKYRCELTSQEYLFKITFDKYNEIDNILDEINIYNVVLQVNYFRKDHFIKPILYHDQSISNLNSLYYNYNYNSEISKTNDTILVSEILKLYQKYIFSNIHPIPNNNLEIKKPISKVSNNINRLLQKCYQKESLVKDLFKSTVIRNDNMELNDMNNINIICDYKIVDYMKIILELCSNKLDNIKKDTCTLDTNIIICNKYQIYKWELINKNKQIKIVTTDKDLNNFKDIKKYKIVILLDSILLYFTELSKIKKYKYSRFIFQSSLYLTYSKYLNNIVYSVYIFTTKLSLFDNMEIIYNTHLYNTYDRRKKMVYDIFYKIEYINNIILQNEKIKLDNNTINSYLEYLNNVLLLNDTNNEIDIIEKYNYHIIKHNYNNHTITDKVMDLIEDNKVEDIIHTNNIFEIKNFDIDFLEEKLKDVCSICLDECVKPTITSCCKQLLCLKCNLFCLKENKNCVLCRQAIDERNKINIVKNNLELKERKNITSIKEIKDTSEIFNKKYILDKTIEYILSNSEWNRKIIIVTNFGENVYGDYCDYRASHDVKEILTKYDINSYNIFKFSLNCIKRKMKEFNTIGGVLIIPNLEYFNKLNIEINTDYIIHYHNMENNNIYNKNREMYNVVLKYNKNPLESFKNIIKNNNVTVFDLVI